MMVNNCIEESVTIKAHPDEEQNGSTKAFAHRSCRHMPQVRASKNASLSFTNVRHEIRQV